MYTVFAEHYHDDRHTRMRTFAFDSLDAVEAWMLKRSNPSSSSFIVPCEETRRAYCNPHSIRLGWLPDSFEWWVHKIEGPRGIVFSDGTLMCGKPFIARSVQAMLERFWAESKEPESRFCDEPAEPPCVRIPAEDAAVFRARIDEMKAIYADEGRSDWFDADDIAREIAESLDLLLAAQGA